MKSPSLFRKLQDAKLKRQDAKLTRRFDKLLNDIYIIDSKWSEVDIVALNERVQRKVTKNPILARIVTMDPRGRSLLSVACTLEHKSKIELFHPAIKSLIEANPSALLRKDDRQRTITCEIARHSSNYVLMPWIAKNCHWVLNEEFLNPPVFCLIDQYTNRGAITECSAAIIREFFEAYPIGLTQVNKYGYTPLHAIVMGPIECNVDLFKWMAVQDPSIMLETDSGGQPPLHRACWALTYLLGEKSSEICKYLIAKCPQSVRVLDDKRRLPIHYLLEHCQHQKVKEVVVCVLREYPESYNMASEFIPAPSIVSFIQRIKPLLDEERELKVNIAYLQEVSESFLDAMDGTQTPSSLASSTCDVFVNWANVSFVQRLEAKIEQIVTQLQRMSAM